MTDSLLAAIRAVPMRCGNCGLTGDIQAGCGASYQHAWKTDDAAIVRAVRAWLRSVEPTGWEIADVLDGIGGSSALVRDLRDLYRRAWSAGEEMP